MGFEIVRLDHVQLAMPPGGRREAEAFYSGLLGLSAPAQARAAGGAGRLLVRPGAGGAPPRGGGGLPARPQGPPGPGGRATLPALEAALRAAGVAVRPNPDTAPGTGAYVDDPFGNRIELIAGT